MFRFYFGIIADITPPVALRSCRLGHRQGQSLQDGGQRLEAGHRRSPGALHVRALNPKLIMIGGTFAEALPMILTSLAGLFGISGGLIGYLTP